MAGRGAQLVENQPVRRCRASRRAIRRRRFRSRGCGRVSPWRHACRDGSSFTACPRGMLRQSRFTWRLSPRLIRPRFCQPLVWGSLAPPPTRPRRGWLAFGRRCRSIASGACRKGRCRIINVSGDLMTRSDQARKRW